jgi:sRNA-binding carbon storage regulator CsrA
MLVLSRKPGESVVINDLIITVDSFADDHCILSLMRTNCEFLRKLSAPFNEYVEVMADLRAVMIHVKGDKVRLGFDFPRHYSIARWEAWDPRKER